MGRKVVLVAAIVLVAVLSAGLVGGQVGGGFFWWGNHEPIYIYGNDDFTIRNGVASGSGTREDPYIIEGWRIDAPNVEYGIYVDHTTSHFIVRDCVIERARIAGVYFNCVRNARVEACQISLSDTAVYFLNSDENVLEGNVVAESKYGVVLAADSRGNRIVGNSFVDNGLNGYDPQRRNCWFDESGGNYWSDYRGADENGDGTGEEPYYPLWDCHPLVSPPVEWTRVSSAGPLYAGHRVSPQGALVVTSETPITLASTDPGSGLAEIRYAIDEGGWLAYTGPILLTGEDGPRRITFYGIDRLGNEEPKQSACFLVDNHPPETALDVGEPKVENERGIWVTSATRVTLRLVRGSSYGATRTLFRIDAGNWQLYCEPFVVRRPDGPHQLTFYSQNASGVSEPLQTVTLIVDNTAPSTRGAQTATSVEVRVEPRPLPDGNGAVEETAQTASDLGTSQEQIQTSSEVSENAGVVQTPSETAGESEGGEF